jgi:hypothetical protein
VRKIPFDWPELDRLQVNEPRQSVNRDDVHAVRGPMDNNRGSLSQICQFLAERLVE